MPGALSRWPGSGAVDQPGDAVHDPQVAVHAVGDGGPLDLQHGVAAVGAARSACTWAIDAADSGTGSTSANSSAAGAPRSSSTMAERLAAGNGRHVVEGAQAGVGQRGGEHARRRRDHLAELHERRAERHERLDQRRWRRRRRGAAGPLASRRQAHAGRAGGAPRDAGWPGPRTARSTSQISAPRTASRQPKRVQARRLGRLGGAGRRRAPPQHGTVAGGSRVRRRLRRAASPPE